MEKNLASSNISAHRNEDALRKQHLRVAKRREKYMFVLRRPQKSAPKWSVKDVERLVQGKLMSRCSRREDQCRQCVIAFGASAKAGINWKEFRDVIIGKLLVPVSVKQVRLLWEKYDDKNEGRITFHKLMTNLMPNDYDLPSSRAKLDASGTLWGYQFVDKSRKPKTFNVTRTWSVDELFARMRNTLILRGGGFPAALKYYSMQDGRNNNSGLNVDKLGMRVIVQKKFKLPATNAEVDALFDQFDSKKSGSIPFIEMYKQLDVGRKFGQVDAPRLVRGPADWDPTQGQTTDLGAMKRIRRSFVVNNEDLKSCLSTSSWGTASTASIPTRSVLSISSHISNQTVGRQSEKTSRGWQSNRSSRRPRSAISVRTNLSDAQHQRPMSAKSSSSNPVLLNTDHKAKPKMSNKPVSQNLQKLDSEIDPIIEKKGKSNEDVESDIGDSASVAMEKLQRFGRSSSLAILEKVRSRERQFKSVSSSSTSNIFRSGSFGARGKETIAAAIVAANHFRRIRTLANQEGRMVSANRNLKKNSSLHGAATFTTENYWKQ
jgi:Ca2+-binding EF-hand superfamily protein